MTQVITRSQTLFLELPPLDATKDYPVSLLNQLCLQGRETEMRFTLMELTLPPITWITWTGGYFFTFVFQAMTLPSQPILSVQFDLPQGNYDTNSLRVAMDAFLAPYFVSVSHPGTKYEFQGTNLGVVVPKWIVVANHTVSELTGLKNNLVKNTFDGTGFLRAPDDSTFPTPSIAYMRVNWLPKDPNMDNLNDQQSVVTGNIFSRLAIPDTTKTTYFNINSACDYFQTLGLPIITDFRISFTDEYNRYIYTTTNVGVVLRVDYFAPDTRLDELNRDMTQMRETLQLMWLSKNPLK